MTTWPAGLSWWEKRASAWMLRSVERSLSKHPTQDRRSVPLRLWWQRLTRRMSDPSPSPWRLRGSRRKSTKSRRRTASSTSGSWEESPAGRLWLRRSRQEEYLRRGRRRASSPPASLHSLPSGLQRRRQIRRFLTVMQSPCLGAAKV